MTGQFHFPIGIPIFEPEKPETMNIEEITEYCMSKPGVTGEFPFDATTLVFKVMGKMFALTNLEGDWSLSLKCDPERAIELREEHPAIQPAYHMNKTHWNTVYMDGSLSTKLILELVDHSYQLVVDKASSPTLLRRRRESGQ